MRIPVNDEHKFRQIIPCAEEIFRYVKEHPDLTDAPWGFDSGSYSSDLNQISASFSCWSVSGWGKEKLGVSALRETDDSWKISHGVVRRT